MVRVAVFASGSGSNLQSLIDRLNTRADAPAHIALVVSDRSDARALTRAEAAGIPSRVIPVVGRDADTVAAETLDALGAAHIDALALAGYLKLVPPAVTHAYRYRILNIHPALLPSFGGKGMFGIRVHRAVLEAGCTVTGATVHFVDERYDEGKVLAQWPVPVLRGDTPETLAARVLQVEHALYPVTVEWLARRMTDGFPDAPASDGTEGLSQAWNGFADGSAARAFELRELAEVETELRRALGLDGGARVMPA